jgi:hypothetical protein
MDLTLICASVSTGCDLSDPVEGFLLEAISITPRQGAATSKTHEADEFPAAGSVPSVEVDGVDLRVAAVDLQRANPRSVIDGRVQGASHRRPLSPSSPADMLFGS